MPKKEMPRIYSASVSYNGNANKFDSILAAMINDCLKSDWIPLYVESKGLERNGRCRQQMQN